jgi:mono/diheme cytochrome c family protein
MKFKRFGYFSTSLLIGLLALLLLNNSCQHDGIPADQFDQICFEADVLPIFQNSCASCHGPSRNEAGLDFSTYTGIMKAITAGNADKSKAYQSITSTLQLMPPDNALPASKRTIIRLWIEQGAKETTCGTTGGNGGTKSGTLWACYDRDIQPILMSSCAVSGCHNATSHKEGIDFSSYTKTLGTISKGNPGGSKMYKAITASQSSEDFMPPKPYSALSKAAIDTIYSWIKRGGLNEECASPCDTTGTIKYTSHIKSIIDLYCVSCHGTNSPSGGIKLLTASDVQAVAKTGKLLAAVKRKTATTAMPPAYPLSTCDVRQIELWINQGYN